MRWGLAIVLFGGSAGGLGLAMPTLHAQPVRLAPDAAHWLDLARAVQLLGDSAIVARLGHDDLEERIAAGRGTRFMGVPERAIGALAQLARSDDPAQSSAAGHALANLLAEIGQSEPSRLELLADEIGAADAELGRVLEDETVRADIRAAAQLLRERLLGSGQRVTFD